MRLLIHCADSFYFYWNLYGRNKGDLEFSMNDSMMSLHNQYWCMLHMTFIIVFPSTILEQFSYFVKSFCQKSCHILFQYASITYTRVLSPLKRTRCMFLMCSVEDSEYLWFWCDCMIILRVVPVIAFFQKAKYTHYTYEWA